MWGFVPVQPNDSLELNQGLQGTCSFFQQCEQPPILRRAFQPDKAMQAASVLQLGRRACRAVHGATFAGSLAGVDSKGFMLGLMLCNTLWLLPALVPGGACKRL